MNDADLKKVENYLKKEFPFSGNTPDQYYVNDPNNSVTVGSSNKYLKSFMDDLGYYSKFLIGIE